MHHRRALALAALLLSSTVAAAAQQPVSHYDLNIPATDLSESLKQIALEAGVNLVAPAEIVEGRKSSAVRGTFTVDEALERALAGTGLTFTRANGAVLIMGPPGSGDAAQKAEAASDIVVTGTRIRGAPIASPVIRLDRDQIKARGQASLADAIRTIPQNFGGGQNPGVGNNVPETSGVNVGSATSINLRGLGSDATLTLINGHRLSYSASRQAIDISMIPFGAVERIEIVPDGASALYGSDAIAGVANIILRRNFRGIETSAHLGGATDGGDFEQRYGVTAGTGWGSGGIVASYEFATNTRIVGKDRSYTASQSPALTLFPFMRSNSASISAHQSIGDRISFDVDALVNERLSKSSYALSGSDVHASGIALKFNSKSFVVAPTLSFRPSGSWNLFLTGSLAQDHVYYDLKSFAGGSVFEFPDNCYCNRAASFEAGGDGTLLRLPAGPLKLAAGAGYRTNTLDRYNGPGATSNVLKTQDSYYAYGELSLPLIAPDQNIRFADSLSLSGAARYERYPGIGDVVTPKVGIIYGLNPDVTFKGSWGKSFRAPTLYQQYQNNDVVLGRPSSFGGSGFPANATVLYIQGGRPDLKPERATSWSATLDVHPYRIPGLELEASWFNTHYKDRVVTPILFRSQALSDPVNAGRLTFNPPAALVSEIIATGNNFVNNIGGPVIPANVAVLIDNRQINAGWRKVHGADFLLNYAAPLGGNLGEIRAALNATYLASKQQLTPTQPIVSLAGILFNPPHFSARGDLGWTRQALSINAGLNYLGGVTDPRIRPPADIHGMTTFDLTARLRSGAAHGLARGIDASLAVRNMFNAKPARIFTTLPSEAPYDSTNYSAVGRFIGLSVTKTW
jgi:outer membrane receptor protein involved in Fe transport